MNIPENQVMLITHDLLPPLAVDPTTRRIYIFCQDVIEPADLVMHMVRDEVLLLDVGIFIDVDVFCKDANDERTGLAEMARQVILRTVSEKLTEHPNNIN